MHNCYMILNLKPREGTTLFTFDLAIGIPSTIVRGCRIVRANSGKLFFSAPQQEFTKNGEKRYYNVVEIHETVKAMVLREIMSRPDGGGCQPGPSGGHGPQGPMQQPQGQYPPRQSHPQGYDDNYSSYQGEADDIPF